jgi:5-methyltetrahydrofolate--homocysteine methyltransferase
MGILQEVAESVKEGNAARVKELTEAALGEGISAQEVLQQGLIDAMTTVRKQFEMKEIYLPEVLLVSRAMKAGMDTLEPALIAARAKPAAKVALGTVQGDPHVIGHMIVGMMLRGAGFQVVELGGDVPPQTFVKAAINEGAHIVGMSCLVTTARPHMIATIKALEAAGLKGKVRTLVGGAIITKNYASKIGADGYAADGALAVEKAKELLGLG